MIEALGRIGFGLFGLAVLIGIVWLFSNNRRAVDWKLVGTGVFLQIAFAAVVLRVPGGREVFDWLSHGFVRILGFVSQGSNFIFGSLMDMEKHGFIFAFQVLPTIIFFSALMGVLYHLGAMQAVVRGMAWAITKVMRVSGAETTSVCASVFIGQTEAPLTVRPYIAKMTQSELLTMMIGGMAHIAGGVLAAYVGMLGGGDPEQQAFFAKHLLAASIMAAPATLVIAKILVPETGEPLTRGTVKMEVEKTTANVIDAAAAGAGDGLRLALNIGAMLLAFIALIALVDAPLVWLGEISGIAGWLGQPTSLSTILGYLLAPIAWVIGVPWADATTVGSLIGQKIVLNEFIAYSQLSNIINGQVPDVSLSPQATLIATYALCGFANFSSIAIQIGGIGGLAPERRQDLARFGLRAVLGGSVATFMTATIAGVLTYLG
ncbi:NupC/NupG family nucleoside CNT transporter [Pseudoxanthomonas suwonensis]|uniref:Na+ dependent nucleoside transporter domain-containing protein n=1 Tax=Pseudoxanthomonas suwonensis TaxID=314722 RepID=A0A0E3UMM2_9GAMM|nr:nucleoside transporter C-terminal domain-containing protein [Pseudoxanthomonas suwonensis]AKC86160.1 Na+ dependent nucleoside transporter domain-containing protein [Pseudoxanthomonas suwonensis]